MLNTGSWSLYFLPADYTPEQAENKLTATFELDPSALRFHAKLRRDRNRRILEFLSRESGISGLVVAAFLRNSELLNEYGDAYLHVGGQELGNIARMVEELRMRLTQTNCVLPVVSASKPNRWRGQVTKEATAILFNCTSNPDMTRN